jgi:hypothetical protein
MKDLWARAAVELLKMRKNKYVKSLFSFFHPTDVEKIIHLVVTSPEMNNDI